MFNVRQLAQIVRDIADLEHKDLVKLEALFVKFYPEQATAIAYAFKRRYNELEKQNV